jgi:predicted acyltransferase
MRKIIILRKRLSNYFKRLLADEWYATSLQTAELYLIYRMPALSADNTTKRLLSLDVMRGLIMILLAAESCLLYESLGSLEFTGVSGSLVRQFFHHPWHGLHFWDLVQPAFMTMAGASLFISFYHKKNKGVSWQENFKHIVIRCFKLFLFGTALHCVYAGKLVWELWNVLTQLAFTTLIAYLIIQRSTAFQVIVSIALLIITELLYRYVLVDGYTEPFVTGKNFGNWMDMVLMGKINTDGWVAINIIPTAAHTIWGCLAGKVLISASSPNRKIGALLIAALICLTIGYTLDLSGLTPIIKRISTSSFVLVSGGWVLLMMALLYWITDVRQYKKYAWIFVVTGMNAIFIYLFFETVGHQWLDPTISIFVKGVLGFTAIPEKIQEVFSAIVTLFTEWYICYWLYKKKIFFKL